MPQEAVQLFAAGHIPEAVALLPVLLFLRCRFFWHPQTHRIISACGSEQRAPGGKGDGQNGALVAFQGCPFLAGGNVPELDGVVRAGGGQQLAIKRIRLGRDNVGMTFQGGP